MLESILDKASSRKLRLFVVACCKDIWLTGSDEIWREPFEIAKRCIDGEAPSDHFNRALQEAVAGDFVARQRRFPGRSDGPTSGLMGGKDWLWQHLHDLHNAIAVYRSSESEPDERQGAREYIEAVLLFFCVRPGADSSERRLIEETQIFLLRDIFGNPFRPLPPRPEAIAPLAEQIYAGAWDQMPLLGEWLQEHGYWSEGEHCLDPNNHHVKGCWVVDWVTGRD
jgi:hypothetical protein